MDPERIRSELAAQRDYCAGRSPLYHEVLAALAADAARGAGWLGGAARAWSSRRFVLGWEAAHLLLACLHERALRGDAPELAAAYPSCAGRARHAGRAATAYLRRASAAFWEELGGALLQTNEVERGIAWLLPARAFAARSLPFHLVELGAAAGLGLIADRFGPACRLSSPWGSPEAAHGPPPRVLSRTGLDPRPRRPEEEADRRWLRACVWADDLPRLARLDRALELSRSLAGTPARPGLAASEFEGMPGWLEANIPPRRGEGLLVFNAAATAFLDDEAYAILRERMAAVLAPWDGRAMWAECELPRGSGLRHHELAVHQVLDGRLSTSLRAVMDARPSEVRLLEEAL